MERKRDLIISWQYVSLAMNQGAIKRGLTVCCFVQKFASTKMCLSSEISDDGCHEMSFFIRNISNSDKNTPSSFNILVIVK